MKRHRIHPAARRHGVTDEDVLHAFRNPIRRFTDQGDWDLIMHVGPTADGLSLVEVGFVTADDGRVVILHAMPARPKYTK